MGLRQKAWARRKLAELRGVMGGECVRCGSRSELEMDCIIPQGDAHHRMSSDQKATFYRREWMRGNLQLLCAPCHSEKSVGEHPSRIRGAHVPAEACPF